ncbi:uncharacterized protein BJ171DRAFT_506592 [Polychytrium aggregatum]|uniref:uncharacterized protein n=1 Tax=Polychytrium aggregatum TaxID=110093 RepID=UPI0022FE517E|nr:uncharacterized protein BJ171DRAFT_506592 [Polychytrium aggregatum]KAI9204215.1 hypothetical protein BJ171DRAFT_506592 [Polychytrium aggregatum]
MIPQLGLGRWLLFIGVMAAYNAVQCFVPSMRLTPKIYARKANEVTPLMSRMMGLWTLVSAIVRIYTAYNLDNRPLYEICMLTFVVALGSFASEIFVYGTAPISSPGVFPTLIITPVSLAWMFLNYPN